MESLLFFLSESESDRKLLDLIESKVWNLEVTKVMVNLVGTGV